MNIQQNILYSRATLLGRSKPLTLSFSQRLIQHAFSASFQRATKNAVILDDKVAVRYRGALGKIIDEVPQKSDIVRVKARL